jgi:DNA mismatch repair ATPase MutS
VPNDVRLTPASRMWVITGSNMAGKSTFLRMVGVNVLLAQIGSPAVAREMTWSPLRLMTDLQARDNLAEDESYFLAEVRHLRRMVVPPEESGVLLGLIDEPFRGTNSQDQSAASVAVLRHLLRSATLVVLATHDRHLTRLDTDQAVMNFHFREDLSSAGMVFDYHLHEGPAQTRNALRVLEHEGYPPAILADAHAWLSRTVEADPWCRKP